MKKSFMRVCLAIASVLTFASTSEAQLITSDMLGLNGSVAEVYSKAITNPYNPANIQLGDSLLSASSDEDTYLAGIILKAYPLFAGGDFASADSLVSLVMDKTLDTRKQAYYSAYTLMATMHMAANDYHGTLKMAQDMSRRAQSDHDPTGLYSSYYMMGTTFVMRDNPRLAHMYFSQAKDVAEKHNMNEKLWACYLQLANCYSAMKNDAKANEFANKAVEAAKACENPSIAKRVDVACLIIAPKYYTPQEYVRVFEELSSTPAFQTLAAGDDAQIAWAQYWCYKGNMDSALVACEPIEVGVNKLNNQEVVYLHFGHWKEAYECRFKADMVHDSLQAVILNEDLAAMDSELNNAELRHQKEQLEVRNKQTIVLSIFIVALLLLGFVLLQYHQKQKQMKKQKDYLEAEVKRQVSELEQKSEIIEQKNRDITASIQYAQRIQHAILPDINDYARYNISGAFTFFVPYHIVSGDFYWANKKGSKLMFACADCTGHGVPGAFMSMIGTTILNDICSAEKELTPAEVLEAMDAELLKVLSQNNTSEVQDGMDMSFVVYDSETHKLSIAAARRPVYVFHKGELVEIKGTKRSIGEHDDMYRKNAFELNIMEVEQGDTLYICSDGIADQFGGQNEFGPRGKRLKSGGLKKILETVHTLDIDKQRDAIEALYLEWRGTCAQVDDVSLLGVRF